MFSLKPILIVVLCLISMSGIAAPPIPGYVRAPGDTLPVPPASPNLLFYVQRTSNINTIVYEINTAADHKIDVDDPIHIYWIRYAENGQKEELSYIQRNFAYGLNLRNLKFGAFEMSFVSYKKMKLSLQYSESEKKYVVYTMLGARRIKVSRLFVKIDGGSFWVPKVTYVEIDGVDVATGSPVTERFKPQ